MQLARKVSEGTEAFSSSKESFLSMPFLCLKAEESTEGNEIDHKR